ncbi:hypothetical protein [Streptomyces lydicus]
MVVSVAVVTVVVTGLAVVGRVAGRRAGHPDGQLPLDRLLVV